MKNRFTMITLVATAFLFANAFADIEDTVEKSFKVGDNGALTVQSCQGSIEVQAAGTGEVKIVIHRKFDADSENGKESILKDYTFEFRQSGDDVALTVTRKDRDRFFGIGRSQLQLRYIITVPQKYSVDLATSGGSISVADLHGKVLARTSGGSLSFGQIQGPVTGKTSGGSITLQGCSGDADVRTSGGSIRLGQVDGQVSAHTSGGSISIDQAKGNVMAATSGGGIDVKEVMGTIQASTSGGSVKASLSQQPSADCKLSTSGGSITVTLAADIKLNLDAATSGGRVVTEFPVTVQGELSKTRLQTEINGGGPILTLRTSGGSIYINKVK